MYTHIPTHTHIYFMYNKKYHSQFGFIKYTLQTHFYKYSFFFFYKTLKKTKKTAL